MDCRWSDDGPLPESMTVYPDSKVHGANMGPTSVQVQEKHWNKSYQNNLTGDWRSDA